jgi:hypothetical protein
LDRRVSLCLNSFCYLLLFHRLLSFTFVACLFELSHFNAEASSWIGSFYWCLTTLTTTGYGDITPLTSSDTLVSIIAIFFGSLLFASIIGQFVNSLQGNGSSDKVIQHYQSTVNKFSKFIEDRCQNQQPDIPTVSSSQLASTYSSLSNTAVQQRIDIIMEVTNLPDHLEVRFTL